MLRVHLPLLNMALAIFLDWKSQSAYRGVVQVVVISKKYLFFCIVSTLLLFNILLYFLNAYLKIQLFVLLPKLAPRSLLSLYLIYFGRQLVDHYDLRSTIRITQDEFQCMKSSKKMEVSCGSSGSSSKTQVVTKPRRYRD